MKTIKFFPLLFSALAITATSCKKQNAIPESSNAEQEITFEISSGQAFADNVTEDANGVFMEAAASRNLLGGNSQNITTTNGLNGAIISVTPANAFPKTITINFGAGLTATNGVTRSGKITVVLSDYVTKTGSTAVITFTNYAVNGFKKEGTIIVTNKSTAAAKAWQRKVENGKITAPNGRYWLHSGIRDAVQITGAATPNTLLDDTYLITGNHSVTNAAGKTKNCYITEALEKKVVCDNIATGKLKVEGVNHTATIDFGNGDCDKIATVSINGSTPRTITLR
jgi:hypothetical protein